MARKRWRMDYDSVASVEFCVPCSSILWDRTLTEYLITWRNSSRAEISARLLKQTLLKSNCRLHGEGFSPGRNSARDKNPSPVLIFKPGWDFNPRQTGWEIHVIATIFFHPGPKREREHAHRLCFLTSVNLILMEICGLRPGWNWACNRYNIGAKFQPGLKLTM